MNRWMDEWMNEMKSVASGDTVPVVSERQMQRWLSLQSLSMRDHLRAKHSVRDL